MPISKEKPAIFLGHVNSLRATGGGVQVCNTEYMTSLTEAGYELHVIPFEYHNTFVQKIKRRIWPRVFHKTTPAGLLEAVEATIASTGARTVFFSLAAFPELSRSLRASHPEIQQVILSHGLESIDFCIEQRVRWRLDRENRSRAQAERMLGGELLDEVEQRRFIDVVLTLSPLEVHFERWLGAQHALWVPRTIAGTPIPSRPVDGRAGCVGTLNHPPNIDGFVSLFDALESRAPEGFRFRLVGGPVADGEAFAKRYPFIDYLGPLSDEALEAEAQTWCCFANPIFVQSKGCSTKLAVALGWGLPIATTRYGARGYIWDEAVVPCAQSPEELADMILQRSTTADFAHHREQAMKIVALTPKMPEVAAAISAFLAGQGSRSF